MKRIAINITSWIVTLATPLFLVGLALCLMLAPWFLHLEYRMPYFPADEYGFTTQDRLLWAPYALDYLINDAPSSYLGDLRFDDGSPLYNERELLHMEDVQRVVQWALRTWLMSVVILILVGIWAWKADWKKHYRLGLSRGGWFSLGLLAALGLYAAIDFWGFFTFFHSLFFKGDSWLFEYSDTLIRLFPLRFWQDVFIWAGVIVVGGALALGAGLRRGKMQMERRDPTAEEGG